MQELGPMGLHLEQGAGKTRLVCMAKDPGHTIRGGQLGIQRRRQGGATCPQCVVHRAFQNKVLQVLNIVTSPSPRQNRLPGGRVSVRPRAEPAKAAVALQTPPLTALLHFKVRTASAQLGVVAQHSKRAQDLRVGRGSGPAQILPRRVKRENPSHMRAQSNTPRGSSARVGVRGPLL